MIQVQVLGFRAYGLMLTIQVLRRRVGTSAEGLGFRDQYMNTK